MLLFSAVLGTAVCREAKAQAVGMEAQAERIVLVETLQPCGGNKDTAALRLDLSRRTLYSKLSRYGD